MHLCIYVEAISKFMLKYVDVTKLGETKKVCCAVFPLKKKIWDRTKPTSFTFYNSIYRPLWNSNSLQVMEDSGLDFSSGRYCLY